MKKIICLLTVTLILMAGALIVKAADVGISVNVNVDNGPSDVVLAEPPIFLYPPALGFYVAVGIPYNLFYVDFNYYLYRGNTWFIASSYNGPWVAVRYERLPRRLRRYKYHRLITIRDKEFQRYDHDRDHYQGKFYRPKQYELKEERYEKYDQRDRGREHRQH